MIEAIVPTKTVTINNTIAKKNPSNHLKTHLLEEAMDLVSRNLLITASVDAAEGRVGLEVEHLAQDLPLMLNVELTLGHLFQEVSQFVLGVQAQHFSFVILKN